MGKECQDSQMDDVKKKILLHVADLLEEKDLINREEKNAMKMIIYQQRPE